MMMIDEASQISPDLLCGDRIQSREKVNKIIPKVKDPIRIYLFMPAFIPGNEVIVFFRSLSISLTNSRWP